MGLRLPSHAVKACAAGARNEISLRIQPLLDVLTASAKSQVSVSSWRVSPTFGSTTSERGARFFPGQDQHTIMYAL